MKTFLLSNIEYKVIFEYKVILITFGLKNFKAFSFVRDYCILTIQVFNLKYMQYDELFNFQDHFIRQLRISRVEMLNVCVIIVSYSLSMYIALADDNSGNVTRASHTYT